MNHAVLDCRAMPPEERIEYWEDGVQRLIDCRIRAEPLASAPLETTLEKCDLGELSLLAIQGGAQRVWLQPPSGFRGLMLMTARTAGGWLLHDEPSPIRLGDAYVLDAQRPWRLELTQPFEHQVLLLPSHAARPASDYLDGKPQAVLPLRGVGELFSRLLDAAFAAVHALTPQAHRVVARTLVELLDSAIADAQAANPRDGSRLAGFHRRRIREYALARLQDPELDVQTIAQAVRLSVRHVHQLFAAEGQSLMRWIAGQRLERGRAQLEAAAGSGLHVSDVAYACGFRDPNHFSRAFRRAYGMSPSELALGGSRDESAAPGRRRRDGGDGGA